MPRPNGRNAAGKPELGSAERWFSSLPGNNTWRLVSISRRPRCEPWTLRLVSMRRPKSLTPKGYIHRIRRCISRILTYLATRVSPGVSPDMAKHALFNYRTLDEVRAHAKELGLSLKASDSIQALLKPVKVGNLTAPNSLAVHPMEGCDGTPEGAPDELTFRRYRRFAAGGAGLLWLEATAVVHEGRANPRQIFLNEKTYDEFARLVDESHKAAKASMGPNHRPIVIVQLTHSGRYSKPEGKAAPIIAHHSAVLDKRQAQECIIKRLPTFIYMDDYRTLEGNARLDQVLQRLDQPLPQDETLLMIFKLAGLDLKKLVGRNATTCRRRFPTISLQADRMKS
jgi:hypothetical protein